MAPATELGARRNAKSLQGAGPLGASIAEPELRGLRPGAFLVWHDRCTLVEKMEAPNLAVPLASEVRLDLLRGMLCRLEDATSAGQHYLMEKVLPLLRREALDPNKRFRQSDLEVINRSLEDLEHEASRLAPDSSNFGQKAQLLVDVFAVG